MDVSELQKEYFKIKLKYNFAHYRYNDKVIPLKTQLCLAALCNAISTLEIDLTGTDLSYETIQYAALSKLSVEIPDTRQYYRHTHTYVLKTPTLDTLTQIYVSTLEDSISPYIFYMFTNPEYSFKDVYNLQKVQTLLEKNTVQTYADMWERPVGAVNSLVNVIDIPKSHKQKLGHIYLAYLLEMWYMLKTHLSDSEYLYMMHSTVPKKCVLQGYVYTHEYELVIPLSDDPAVRYKQIKEYVAGIDSAWICAIVDANYSIELAQLAGTFIDNALWRMLNMRFLTLYNFAKTRKIYKSIKDLPTGFYSESSEETSDLAKLISKDFADSTSESRTSPDKETPDPDKAESAPKEEKDFLEYNHVLDGGSGSFKTSMYQMQVINAKYEQTVDDKAIEAYNKIAARSKIYTASFAKQLREIKSYNTGYKDSGKSAGKLDRKNLYRHKFDSHIFYNNEYKQKESDLAVGIMLDASGSMRGTGIENGLLTVLTLHEVLRSLNINHSIMDHTNCGRNHTCDVRVYQYFKDCKEYSPNRAYQIANIRARYGNCDSGALWYMEQALLRTKNKDKICLMFSDGAPTECSGADLVNQVAHMERNGIVVIGIGINFPEIAQYYTKYANGKNLGQMLNITSKILKEYILHKKE